MNPNEPYVPPEYPFGFGFTLMQTPRAMEHFKEMNESQRRELGRKLRAVSSDEDWKDLIRELSLRPPIS